MKIPPACAKTGAPPLSRRRHASLRRWPNESEGFSGARVGVVEYFRPGDRAAVDSVLSVLRALRVKDLRTIVSWADWDSRQGESWYAWLLPRLSEEVNLLPCVLYTSPAQAVAPHESAPPWDPKAYGDFIDVLITRLGNCFEWIELWDEPDRLTEWDRTLDPHWQTYCAMIGGAAYWAQRRGKRTVLGGLRVFDPNWLELMFRRGVMQYIDAVGIHAFPGSSELTWKNWSPLIDLVQQSLNHHRSGAEIWITSTGYSTWRHDEYEQLKTFADALENPVERVYWYTVRDLNPEYSTRQGFHADDRDYHFGLLHDDGTPKLLARLWSDNGLEAIRAAREPQAPPSRRPRPFRPVVITGGAGFIGTNLAHRLLSAGERVIVFDNLSRPGVERNARWLLDVHGSRVQIEFGDVRNPHALRRVVRDARHVFHFAAQVAVTTSLANPRHDFEVNALGTLNLLEALRAADDPPPLFFTSTNKVYGGLEDIVLTTEEGNYCPVELGIRAAGVNELRSIDLHSPYGCSKGAADQYIIDYARTFHIPAVVFRMSCIYGPHQMGNEDQGWIAHFLISALQQHPITLYGDGMQVRDILYVDDLVDAFLLARENVGKLSAQAFNIGGGPERKISLLELIELIKSLHGKPTDIEFQPWRPGDQRYYVSDTRKFRSATGWSPKVDPGEGTRRLYEWLQNAGRADSRPVTDQEPCATDRVRHVAAAAGNGRLQTAEDDTP